MKTMLNIVCSHIPMKYLTFNAKGVLPDKIPVSSKRKQNIQEETNDDRANSDYENLQIIRIDLTGVISTVKT